MLKVLKKTFVLTFISLTSSLQLKKYILKKAPVVDLLSLLNEATVTHTCTRHFPVFFCFFL